MNNNGHKGGFLNGFLWGVIIGSLAVFLLGTKKGKNILKLISEESFELSELFGEEEEQEVKKNKKCAHCKEKSVNHKKSEVAGMESSDFENGEIIPVSSPPRRFFRGLPKRN